MLQEPLFWFSLFLILLLLEVLVTNHVYSLLFSIGALVTGIASLTLTTNSYVLILIFIVTSLIVTFSIRIPLEKFFESRKLGRSSNVDSIIGKKAIVIKDVKPNEKGYVRIDNEEWLAASSENSILETGSEVKVLGIEGTTLIVSLFITESSEVE